MPLPASRHLSFSSSDFAKNIKKNSTIVDLGTGTGIISILLSKKTEAKKIYGIELQEEVCDMASRSVLLNNLQDKIEIIKVTETRRIISIVNKLANVR